MSKVLSKYTFLVDTQLSYPDSNWCNSQVSECYIVLLYFSQHILMKFRLCVRPSARHWVQWFNDTGKNVLLFMYLIF